MRKSLHITSTILLALLGAGASVIIIFTLGIFLLVFLIGGCSNHPIPPDEEMIENFMAHEKEFYEIKDLALKIEDGNYYPPFNRLKGDDKDKSCDKWLTQAEREKLDSLLNVVGCERIYYRERKYYRGVEADSTLSLIYWGRGLSIGGTWKEYQYRPDWELMGYGGKGRIYMGKETADLLEITNYADTIVYKPIKGEWYIELGHDN